MKIVKWLLLAVALLIIASVGAIYYVTVHMSADFIHHVIEASASQATGTKVTVEEFELKVTEGKAAIRGITVANPAGYRDPNIFSLGGISVELNLQESNQKKVVINDISIDSPSIFVETMSGGKTNVDAIRANLKKLTQGNTPASRETEVRPGEKIDILIVIKRLAVNNGKLTSTLPADTGMPPTTLTMPAIELLGIGEKQGGVPPEQVAKIITDRLLDQANNTLTRAMAEESTKRLGNEIDKAVQNAVGKLKF